MIETGLREAGEEESRACMRAWTLARDLPQTHPLSQRPRYTTTR
jgi:hypothetical protein